MVFILTLKFDIWEILSMFFDCVKDGVPLPSDSPFGPVQFAATRHQPIAAYVLAPISPILFPLFCHTS